MKDENYPTCYSVPTSTKDTRNFTRSDNPSDNSEETIESSNTAGGMDVLTPKITLFRPIEYNHRIFKANEIIIKAKT